MPTPTPERPRDEALYTPDGDLLIPGDLTQGPWSPDAQHGGPVAGLLARTIEVVPAPHPMQLVRLTVELLRPVPLKPLSAIAVVTRPGKKVQLVDASLEVDGLEVAKARGLRIRVSPVEVPDLPPEPPSPPVPSDTDPQPLRSDRTAFAGAMDLHFTKGSWDELGPVTMWSRLRVPVVAGESPSPMQRTVAAADFGNGVSRVVDFNTHMFINPDLTVALSRVPMGDWIGFDAVSRLSHEGFGQAESLIFDQSGPVGRAVQALLVERRAPSPG